MKRLMRFLVIGLLLVLIAIVFEPIFLGLNASSGSDVSIYRDGVHLTYELRQLRDKYELSNSEAEKEEITKEAVVLLVKYYWHIPMSKGWLNHAIAEGMINWDVLVCQAPAIAKDIKDSTFLGAKGIVERLRRNVPNDDMNYDRYRCAVQTLIKKPIANGLFTWEDLGTTEKEVNFCLELKRGRLITTV